MVELVRSQHSFDLESLAAWLTVLYCSVDQRDSGGLRQEGGSGRCRDRGYPGGGGSRGSYFTFGTVSEAPGSYVATTTLAV